jgi:type I restriction enzyme M protein
MEPSRLNGIANFIWGIADDVLLDLYVRGKYRRGRSKSLPRY